MVRCRILRHNLNVSSSGLTLSFSFPSEVAVCCNDHKAYITQHPSKTNLPSTTWGKGSDKNGLPRQGDDQLLMINDETIYFHFFRTIVFSLHLCAITVLRMVSNDAALLD
jgi:hypothetical protein